MATRERLWVPVQIKWRILGKSLLKKRFLESQALSYKISLTSLSQFWKISKISYGGY